MPAIRYVVPGATSSAFVPVPAATTAIVQFKRAVTGQPGTQAIPAGLQEFPGGQQVNGLSVRGAGAGYNQGSNTMPGYWFPQLYYERALSETTGEVSIYSDNQMPVPAMDPRGRAARMARPPQFLGQRQVTQLKALPKWANWLPKMPGSAAGASGAFG